MLTFAACVFLQQEFHSRISVLVMGDFGSSNKIRSVSSGERLLWYRVKGNFSEYLGKIQPHLQVLSASILDAQAFCPSFLRECLIVCGIRHSGEVILFFDHPYDCFFRKALWHCDPTSLPMSEDCHAVAVKVRYSIQPVAYSVWSKVLILMVISVSSTGITQWAVGFLSQQLKVVNCR